MLTDLISELNANAGAIQSFSSIVLTIATAFLVIITFIYTKAAKRQAHQAERQVAETREQRFDEFLPVLHPFGNIPIDVDGVDWNKPEMNIQLRNVGRGVALIVCGVLFPPKPETPSKDVIRRYTIWRETPFLPEAHSRIVTLKQGKTIMGGDITIGKYTLFAQKKPSRQEMMVASKYNIVARLTLTYQDIFRRKHAAVFDYIESYGWQCIGLLSNIAKDFEDIDEESHAWASSAG